MGTNFYMVKGAWVPETDYSHPLSPLIREGTGRPAQIHIGKSSGGWCFALRVYPDNGVHTLTDWRHFAARLVGEGWRVEDEYGTEHTLDDLWRVVEREGWKELACKSPCRRHDVDNTHCVGNGEGFYDYMVGEFS
jgi:hypothetical protein